MRIGIDGLPLTEDLTGIGHYTLELANHLAVAASADEIQVVSPRSYLPSLDRQPEGHANLRFVRSRVSPISRHWWSIGLPRYIRRHRLEVFHGTNFEVPLRKVCPTVVTIHDLSMLLYPYTQERKRVRRAQRRLPLMARAATMIITPTESVRREVHEHLQIPLDRIVAVPEAARGCFHRLEAGKTIEIRKLLAIRHEFLLFVGTVEPRKNLSTLLRAFEEVLRVREKPLQLVIAGRKGWLVDDLFESLKHSAAAAKVVFTGYLADEDLCALYSSCAALIYPSIYEGFGLPPLEAMACGAPVIASDIPAIKEVVGSAARLVSAESSGALASSLLDLLDSVSGKKALSDAGVKRAGEFSWRRAATASKGVYTEASERFARLRS
ncbi:MAG TPA: glycosyltransferase family 1 protein [Pyrinomonadaceae bacterium]|nr:glycosyltransferase family 1 protein [Pyrinomonadaceae bacterium]